MKREEKSKVNLNTQLNECENEEETRQKRERILE